jgi:dihydrofolate reductase
VRVAVSKFISLDGVVQAPGGPDEDTSGGFRHGGWSMKYFDPEVMGAVVDEFAGRSEALLQGRRTYQVSRPRGRKVPVSSLTGSTAPRSTSFRTRSPTLTSPPGRRRRSSAAPTSSRRCRPLRGQPGGDIYVYGSLSVVRTLLTAGLVDELVLMIEPITLGGGKTLFPVDGEAREFELTSAETARTGVQVCRYRRAN